MERQGSNWTPTGFQLELSKSEKKLDQVGLCRESFLVISCWIPGHSRWIPYHHSRWIPGHSWSSFLVNSWSFLVDSRWIPGQFLVDSVSFLVVSGSFLCILHSPGDPCRLHH